MSKTLKISDDLSLPIDAATQTFAFIARKGAGKTYAAGKLTELLLEAGVQVVILDTVGNWFGLRLAADGKSKGFDIPVFGGLRGDLPLNADAGSLTADVAVDTGRSLILDLSQFSLSDRKKFATAFGTRLWSKKKAEAHPSPLMLVIEESQLIVPENFGSGDAQMVGIYEEIIRLGRNYGIGAMMISQRPQSVNKEVLNQTECLFVLQVNGAHERKALREWVVHQGMDTKLVDELPSLPIGTAYVWSPQWLQILKKIRIDKKQTYDSSATPKVGQKMSRRDPAPLDLKEVEAKMSAIVEQAKANDPRLLKQELAKLRAELAKAQKPVPAPAAKTQTKTVEKAVLKDGQLKRAEALVEKLAGVFAKAGELQQTAKAMTDEITAAIRKVNQPAPAQAVARVAPVAAWPVRRIAPPARSSSETNGDAASVGKGGLRRILIALAQRPGLTNRQIGVRAGLSSSSGSFSTYLSIARKNGWISDDNDRRFITDEGLIALGDYEPLPSGPALLEHWLSDLGNSGAARILRTLADAYPNALTNEEIGRAAEISHSSGSFSTYMSRLRTLELVESAGRGLSKASDELFEEAMV